MQEISLKKTIELLKSGNFVKFDDQKGYDPETGNSIQSFYGLSKTSTKKLLMHPLLSTIKISLNEFVLVDDLEENTDILDTPQVTNLVAVEEVSRNFTQEEQNLIREEEELPILANEFEIEI